MIPPLTLTPLTGNCYIYTSYHLLDGEPFPANGTCVVTDKEIVLIDSPWTEAHTQDLLDSLKKRFGKPVTHCIATHFHADRTGGFDVLKKNGVKTWSSQQTLELCKKRKEKLADYTFTKDTVFTFDGVSLEIFYPGKGHSPDNIVVWIPEKKVLHGGCFVKSVESKDLGNLEDADVPEWKRSVEKVMKKFPKPAYVIPGHFGWGKGSLKHTFTLLERAAKRK